MNPRCVHTSKILFSGVCVLVIFSMQTGVNTLISRKRGAIQARESSFVVSEESVG